jgi:transposase
MARRVFRLGEEAVLELKRVYAGCRDGPTRTRYQAVRLYGTGYPVEEVMEITGCSRTSLMEWCRKYRSDGAIDLEDKRVGGNRAKLTPAQIKDLRVRLCTYTPADLFDSTAATEDGQFWTVEDLKRAIQRWYGVSYRSRSSYPRLFARCGFRYHRSDKVFKLRGGSGGCRD